MNRKKRRYMKRGEVAYEKERIYKRKLYKL